MSAPEGAFLYILRCSGTTRTTLEQRVAEHNAGALGGYTATRRPVTLAYAEWFERITDAIAAERKLKGWTRAKKEAFIGGDWERVRRLAQRRSSHRSGLSAAEDS